jgi:hypothetical protein
MPDSEPAIDCPVQFLRQISLYLNNKVLTLRPPSAALALARVYNILSNFILVSKFN